MLGYEDGEQISFSEVVYVVERILAVTSLPLSVDLEAGYSHDVSIIIEHVEKLHRLGVVGVNIEDSRVDTEHQRTLVDADTFAGTISTIKNHLKREKIDLFLNVRTDPFLLGISEPINETIVRIKRYEPAGADGIFVPGIEDESDIARVVASTSLPINVMCMPNLPGFEQLQKVGVKRISMGNFLHQSVHRQLAQKISDILEHQSFTPLF